MPQGIKPASHAYQQTMDKTFSDISNSVPPPFFDDVTVKGRTFAEHKQNVIKVLQHIWETGFTLNALKCYVFQHHLPYLGHIIDNGKITLDLSRIKAIHEFPVPTTVKSLCSFLGMAQFCNRFVPHFSTIAAPLHELTKSNTRFQWTEQCQQAFDEIKAHLTTPPVFHPPPPTPYSHIILEMDTSDLGIGNCLKVMETLNDPSEQEHLVAYGSKKFDSTKQMLEHCGKGSLHYYICC